MTSMIDSMLRQAGELVERNSHSSAAKRRAISSASYEAFHRLLSICAGRVGADTPEFEPVNRALDHGTSRHAFAAGPLRTNSVLSGIGFNFGQLQAARINADDSPLLRNLFPSRKK